MTKTKPTRAARPASEKPVAAVIAKPNLLELRMESRALWTLLSEGGSECLWDLLSARLSATAERLSENRHAGDFGEAAEAVRLKGMVDAIFALDCAERDAARLTLDKYDIEAQAAALA